MDMPATPQPTKKPSILETLGTSAAQGLTLGFYDELVGLVSPDQRDKIRDMQSRIQEHRGGLGLAAELATPMGAVGGLAKIPRAVKALDRFADMSKGKKLATTAGASTATGGVSGIGFADGQNVPQSAALGAGAGLAGGLALPLAGAALSPAANYLKSLKAGSQTANTQAGRKIMEAMERDGLTAEQATAKLQSLGPEATLADLGENLAALTQAAASGPSTTKAAAQELFSGRSKSSRDRLNSSMKAAFSQEHDFYGSLKALEDQMRTEAAPFYQRAYATDVPFGDDLKQLAKRPSISAAIKEAKLNAAEEGRQLPMVIKMVDDKPVIEGVPDLQAWDDIKRGLDDVIQDNTDDITGKLNSTARRAQGTKQALLSILDDASPDYAAARRAYSTPAANKTALEKGRKFASLDSEVTEDVLSGMSEAEQQHFRAGAMRAMRDRVLGDSSPRTLLSKLERLGKLEKVFPDKESYKSFRDAVETEAKFQETSNKVLGGSPTQMRQQASEDLKIDPSDMLNIAAGNYGQGVAGFGRSMLARAKLPTADLRDNVGAQLLSQDPIKQALIMRGQLNPSRNSLWGVTQSPVIGLTGGMLGSSQANQ